MYILIEGSKDSYDRPIEISIIGIYLTLEEASKELQKRYLVDDEDFKEALENQQEYISNSWGKEYKLGYTNGYITYYSTGCPADNEYDGTTCIIYKLEV